MTILYQYPPIPAPAAPVGGATEAKQDEQIVLATDLNDIVAKEAKQDVEIAFLNQISDDAASLLLIAATGAKQDTGNASLASIDTKLTSQATAANQTTGNASLSSIDTKLSSQATAANQTTGNASLSSIDTKLPTSIGQKTMANSLPVVLSSDQSPIPVSSAQATLTGSGSALNADIIPSTDVSSYKTAYIQLTGTFVATVTFQGSNDNINFVSVIAQAITSPTSATASTANAVGIFYVPLLFKFLRVRITAYTSGAVTATSQMTGVASEILGRETVSATQSGVWTSNTTQQTVAGTITTAQKTVGTTAVRATVSGSAPSAIRKRLSIKPSANNTGNIYIGASGVTTANGLMFIGPDRMDFEFDSGDYYLISDVAAQVVEILEKA